MNVPHQTTRQPTPEELRIALDQPPHYADLRNGGLIREAFPWGEYTAVAAAVAIGLACGWVANAVFTTLNGGL